MYFSLIFNPLCQSKCYHKISETFLKSRRHWWHFTGLIKIWTVLNIKKSLLPNSNKVILIVSCLRLIEVLLYQIIFNFSISVCLNYCKKCYCKIIKVSKCKGKFNRICTWWMFQTRNPLWTRFQPKVFQNWSGFNFTNYSSMYIKAKPCYKPAQSPWDRDSNNR